jgi:GT2 family glycosyltransferase
MSAGGNAPDDHTLTEITDINYASGSAMYVKGPVIKKLGTFEENFFMYHDDIEYSFKARQVGYRIVVAPKSIMYHKHEFSRSIRQFYYMERNRFLTLLYFYKIPTLILIAPMFIVMELGQWLYALKNGMFVTRLRVYGYFLNPRNLLKAFKRRAELQAQRVIKKDKDFVANFVDRIEFQEVSNPLLVYIGNPLMHGYWQIVKKVLVW